MSVFGPPEKKRNFPKVSLNFSNLISSNANNTNSSLWNQIDKTNYSLNEDSEYKNVHLFRESKINKDILFLKSDNVKKFHFINMYHERGLKKPQKNFSFVSFDNEDKREKWLTSSKSGTLSPPQSRKKTLTNITKTGEENKRKKVSKNLSCSTDQNTEYDLIFKNTFSKVSRRAQTTEDTNKKFVPNKFSGHSQNEIKIINESIHFLRGSLNYIYPKFVYYKIDLAKKAKKEKKNNPHRVTHEFNFPQKKRHDFKSTLSTLSTNNTFGNSTQTDFNLCMTVSSFHKHNKPKTGPHANLFKFRNTLNELRSNRFDPKKRNNTIDINN